jgi:hypothetical protein
MTLFCQFQFQYYFSVFNFSCLHDEGGHGANNFTPEKSTVAKPPDPMEEGHGRSQDKKKRIIGFVKKKIYIV